MVEKENPSQQPITIEEVIRQGNERISKLEAASFDTRVYFQEQTKKVEEKIKEFEQKIDSSKNNVIQALGIFVALFTFIAVNVQIFSKLNDLGSAMWFMLVMGGITLTILLAIELLTDGRGGSNVEKLNWISRNFKILSLILLAIVQITIGIYFTNKNSIRLNPFVSESNKFEIQANVKSITDNPVSLEQKINKKTLP